MIVERLQREGRRNDEMNLADAYYVADVQKGVGILEN